MTGFGEVATTALSVSRRKSSAVGALRDAAIEGTHESQPVSLRGTAVDGALPVDAKGRLIVTPEVRRFFDYFLSATGEEPPDAIRARIRAEIEARLPPGAADEALGLFERYLHYRERARRLTVSRPAAGKLDAWLEQLRQLRWQTLGVTDATALFGDEEAMEAAAVAERQVASDASLSPEERERRLAAIEAQLPESVKATRDAAMAPLRLAREEAELRAAGGSPEEIRALRERYVGPEAAHRLEELDRRRAEWEQRLDGYRQARAAIEADETRSATDRSRVVEALLEERFTPTERLRVQALERIEQEHSQAVSEHAGE